MSNWNLVSTAGSTLAAFTYSPANSTVLYDPIGDSACSGPCIEFTSNAQFSNGAGTNENRILDLSFPTNLTDSGGTVNLFIDNTYDNASHECLDYNPYRLF